MSTDDTQPSEPPAQRSQQQQDYQEPPTVAAPARPAPDAGPREEATRAVPRYAPPPPPPPPPGPPPAAPGPRPTGQPAEQSAEADQMPAGGGDVPPDVTRREVAPDVTRREAIPEVTRREAVPGPAVREPAPAEAAQPAQWQDQWQREQPVPAEAAQSQPGQSQPGQSQPGQAEPGQWQQDQWQQGPGQPGQAQPAAWQQPQWQEGQDGPPRPWSAEAGADGQWPPPGQGPGYQGPGYQGPGNQGRGQRGRRPRRRRVRRSVMALFAVIVLLIVLVIADRVACAITENEFASQIQTDGLGVRPSVNIEGFPFLTQLAAKDFNKVDLDASNVPAGPVTISTVHAVINGMHISSFSSSASAKVDHMTATAFISFGSIMSGLGLDTSTGITTTQDGPDKIKITAGIGGIASDTEEAQISQTGPQTISIKLLNNGGGLGSLLGNGASFSFNLPKGVPASLRITNLSLNAQGLTVSAAASNATLSK